MDLELERKRLLRRDAEWASLSLDGRDVERILPFWTDEAVVFPPGLPTLRGKAALRSYVEGALAIPGFQITWISTDATLSPDGTLAYLLVTNAITLPGPDGKAGETRVAQPKVIAVRVASLDDKEFLLASDPDKFFTELHYNGYPAVLVRLPAVTAPELKSIITEAWRCQAPNGLELKRG